MPEASINPPKARESSIPAMITCPVRIANKGKPSPTRPNKMRNNKPSVLNSLSFTQEDLSHFPMCKPNQFRAIISPRWKVRTPMLSKIAAATQKTSPKPTVSQVLKYITPET